MKIVVLGKCWDLRFVRKLPKSADGSQLAGYCESPDASGKRIRILKGLDSREELEAILHEVDHAAHWHHDEEHVRQYADDVATILWRLGWRKQDGRS